MTTLQHHDIMTKEEFLSLAATATVIPVRKTFLADTLTPVSAYLRLRNGADGSFLFESVEGGEQIGRYSFIGLQPKMIVKSIGTAITIHDEKGERTVTGNLFELLPELTRNYHLPPGLHLPRFSGGWVGVLGYDCVRFIERLPERPRGDELFGDSLLGLFTQIVMFDHLRHEATIIYNACLSAGDDPGRRYDEARTAIERTRSLLRKTEEPASDFHLVSDSLTSGLHKNDFMRLVERAKHYIVDGDIFQVVLSHRFTARFTGDPFNMYRALRVLNPSPYLYFLSMNEESIIGSSPEVLVRMEHRRAEVYPIAGTRHRGGTREEDAALELELRGDEKERAEHIMLVDLGRNDLGRVCEIGSVKVEDLMFIVRYSHVMHLASRVSGILRPGLTGIDALTSAFPAGTVSGAPKIRAMEIIQELEPVPRGYYAGGVGYIDFSGNVDMCIAIRTMFAKQGVVHIQAGAGIVADSNPESEYYETVNKAQAMLSALDLAQGVSQ